MFDVRLWLEITMTSSKAVAAGIAAQFVTIATWLLTLVPHWNVVPGPVQSAIYGLVSAGIAGAVVYYAPANARVINEEELSTRAQ